MNLSDGGYLYDPEAKYGDVLNPDVMPFESLSHIPCLVLLGEPGIGKSQSMQLEREAIDAIVEKHGGQTLWLDLRSYSSEDRLVRNLLETPVFTSWVNGENSLHLFLDSLDECLLRINTMATLLVDELQKHSVERLYLRIACRTADWPNVLEDGLKRLWGDEAVGVYELAPLRRAEVELAAKTEGIDSAAFIGEIDKAEAVPLAIKPITLSFLLNSFRITGGFPSTRAELYLWGCQWLCEETSESRRSARLAGVLTARQRMAIAARIAAVTVFANRYAVWTGMNMGDVPEEDITIQELCGGYESADGQQFGVNEAAVTETLATGLFSSRGPNRLGWAHQTYAEFLAARYLAQHEMPHDQMVNLLIHRADGEERVVPQLHEAAAWLAGMVPALFREITRTDPEVMLRSDVATAGEGERAALIETLLGMYEEEKLLDRGWDTRQRYRKLSHPGLAEQLLPYITDKTKHTVARKVAIDIAEACALQTIQEHLVGLALDESEAITIRKKAAHAICYIGSDRTKAKLKPLARGEAGDDPDDELRAYGLKAVWPHNMTVDDLFPALTPPKRANLIGAYRMFLVSDFTKSLQPDDLPAALEWVAGQPSERNLPNPFGELMDGIMLLGWQCLDSPGVVDAFAKAALTRLKHHDDIVGHSKLDMSFRSEIRDADNKRRQVLEATVSHLVQREEDVLMLVYSQTPLATNKDVLWMIEHLEAAESEDIQRVWAQLIAKAVDPSDPSQSDAVIVASESNPILSKSLAWLLRPVQLESPEAQEMRGNYLKMKDWQERDNAQPLLDPPPDQRIVMLLDQFESGELASWWRLNMEMTLEPTSTEYGNEFESDLTALLGWKSADAKTRRRLVNAALKYVLEEDPKTQEWLGENILHRPAFAGYRALRLLLKQAPGRLVSIRHDVWVKWAPITLAFPTSSGLADETLDKKLLAMAYQHAPEDIIRTLEIMIDKENSEIDHIYIVREVESIWDDRIENALLTKARDEKLKPVCMGDLLEHLLNHRVDVARQFAESLVTIPLPSNENEYFRAIVAARVLMTHTEDVGWAVVCPAIQRASDFGKEVLLSVAHGSDHHERSIGDRLTEEQLTDLYIWLAQQFPQSDDNTKDGVRWMKPRDSVADLRDSLLVHLRQRGTPKACDCIRRIAQEFPESSWLKWILAEAQNITRQRTWMPPQPGDILKIACNQEARLVQNGEHLLEVLIESLKRLEARLQGETPAAIDLWNQIGPNEYRPKDENNLSDYVKRHLDDDLRQRGIIVNREVEIRRGEGSAQGERTDIHVDAISRGAAGEEYDRVTVIIETKGCWNQGLDNAMQTQLLNRYLKDNRCQHGLYLVGWFNCDQWSNDDYRKNHAPKLGKDEAQRRFDAQATDISQRDTLIKALVINTALRRRC